MCDNSTLFELAFLKHPLFPYVLRAVNDVNGELPSYVPTPEELKTAEREAVESGYFPGSGTEMNTKEISEFLLSYLRLLEIEKCEFNYLLESSSQSCELITAGLGLAPGATETTKPTTTESASVPPPLEEDTEDPTKMMHLQFSQDNNDVSVFSSTLSFTPSFTKFPPMSGTTSGSQKRRLNTTDDSAFMAEKKLKMVPDFDTDIFFDEPLLTCLPNQSDLSFSSVFPSALFSDCA